MNGNDQLHKCGAPSLDLISSALRTSFFSLGGDSLAVLELITAMADEHHVTLYSSDLVECPTLGEFAERARKPKMARGGVLVPLRVEGVGPPLFCFAGAGGLAGTFLHLARHLDRPVYGLQAHGLEGGGLPDWTQRGWVVRCLREMRRIQPHGPYFLAGHSFGGMLAWEAAQLLKQDGEEVALLVLIDTLYLTSTRAGTQMDGAERRPDITRHAKVYAVDSTPAAESRTLRNDQRGEILADSSGDEDWPVPLLRGDAPAAIPAFLMGWPNHHLLGEHEAHRT